MELFPSMRYCLALLLCDRSKYFNKNIVYHIKYPFLPNRILYHCRWQVKHLEPNPVFPKILQFSFGIFLVSAQPVQ